jgi:NADH-quinone oxidoreductase subunit N
MIAVLFRIFFFTFINFISIYSLLLIVCSLLSIFIGSIFALYQIKLKKFFAYSTIAHMGHIVLCMSIGSGLSIYVSFYYLIIYLLITISLFTIYLSIYKHDNTNIKNIVDIIYITRSKFHLSFIFAITLLSLAGIPPLAGFYGKLYLFQLLISTGNYFIALYVVLFSVLSCIYYIRFIRFL